MKVLIFTLAVSSMIYSSTVYSAKETVTTKVTKVLVDDTNFGQCMVQLDVPINNIGLECKSNWVTFSCSGDFSSKDIAYHKFENAQISLVLGKKVKIYVDDTKKHNGYCYAYRVDLLKDS